MHLSVISHLLNDSDELHNSPAVLKLHSDYSSLIQTRTKMQPVFDCEVVDILPYNEQVLILYLLMMIDLF